MMARLRFDKCFIRQEEKAVVAFSNKFQASELLALVEALDGQDQALVTKPLVTKPLVTKPLVTKPLVTKPLVTKH